MTRHRSWNLSFPRQPYFDSHIFPKLEFYGLINKLSVHGISFGFSGLFKIVVLILITKLSHLKNNEEIQDVGCFDKSA